MFKEKQSGRKSARPSAEVLSEMYERMTAKAIAEQLGVSHSTVRRWIAEYRKELNTTEVKDHV